MIYSYIYIFIKTIINFFNLISFLSYAISAFTKQNNILEDISLSRPVALGIYNYSMIEREIDKYMT